MTDEDGHGSFQLDSIDLPMAACIAAACLMLMIMIGWPAGQGVCFYAILTRTRMDDQREILESLVPSASVLCDDNDLL